MKSARTKGRKPIPVTVLSGFLGSGKTTLLNHILDNASGMKIVVIVNDMSIVNIDARLIRRTEEKMIELSNGCICCTLREDLLEQLIELGQTSIADAIVIECTGIAEPIHVAETFAHSKTIGKDIEKLVALDTMVTVVDSKHFFDYFKGKKDPHEVALESKTCPNQRTLVDLLIDQVQFADIIILNKTDCVSNSELNDVSGILLDLNPHAKHLKSTFGRIDPNLLINTGLFSYDRAAQHSQWFQEEWGSADLTPESEEYGISSFVFRSSKPFHPGRLKSFFDIIQEKQGAQLPTSPRSPLHRSRRAIDINAARCVVRCKGFLWLASSHNRFILMHLAGGSLHLTHGGKWWADVPRNEWPSGAEFRREVLSHWKEPFGDRSQTIVIIGMHMNVDAVRRHMNSCLLTDEEMSLGPNRWKSFRDEFEYEDVIRPSEIKSTNEENPIDKHADVHVHDESCGHQRKNSDKKKIKRHRDDEADQTSCSHHHGDGNKVQVRDRKIAKQK